MGRAKFVEKVRVLVLTAKNFVLDLVRARQEDLSAKATEVRDETALLAHAYTTALFRSEVPLTAEMRGPAHLRTLMGEAAACVTRIGADHGVPQLYVQAQTHLLARKSSRWALTGRVARGGLRMCPPTPSSETTDDHVSVVDPAHGKPLACANMAYVATKAYLPTRAASTSADLVDRAGMGDAYAATVTKLADSAVTAAAAQIAPVLDGALQTLVAAELGLSGKLGKSAAAYVGRCVRKGQAHLANPSPPPKKRQRTRKGKAAPVERDDDGDSDDDKGDGNGNNRHADGDRDGDDNDDNTKAPAAPVDATATADAAAAAAAAAGDRPARARKRGGPRKRLPKGEVVDAAFQAVVDRAAAGDDDDGDGFAEFDLLGNLERLAARNGWLDQHGLPSSILKTRSPYVRGLPAAKRRQLDQMIRRLVASLPAAFTPEHAARSPMAVMATLFELTRYLEARNTYRVSARRPWTEPVRAFALVSCAHIFDAA